MLTGDRALQLRRPVAVVSKSRQYSGRQVLILLTCLSLRCSFRHLKLIQNKHLSPVKHSLDCCCSSSSKPPAGQPQTYDLPPGVQFPMLQLIWLKNAQKNTQSLFLQSTSIHPSLDCLELAGSEPLPPVHPIQGSPQEYGLHYSTGYLV